MNGSDRKIIYDTIKNWTVEQLEDLDDGIRRLIKKLQDDIQDKLDDIVELEAHRDLIKDKIKLIINREKWKLTNI